MVADQKVPSGQTCGKGFDLLITSIYLGSSQRQKNRPKRASPAPRGLSGSPVSPWAFPGLSLLGMTSNQEGHLGISKPGKDGALELPTAIRGLLVSDLSKQNIIINQIGSGNWMQSWERGWG